MDEHQRQTLHAEREQALAARDRLNVVIAYLSERLGEIPPSGGGGLPLAPQGGAAGGSAGRDPVAGTFDGEYFGDSSTDAAYKVLTKFGSKQHLLKTKDLFDAVVKGGVKITSEEGFYKSLARSNRFKKVGRGTWGLMEWYPNLSPAKKPLAARPGLTNVTPLGDDASSNGKEAGDTEPAPWESPDDAGSGAA